jgi:hypothetical protein
MKTTLLAAALLTTVVPAVAQSPNRTMNEPQLTTCWYSDKGNLTGSQAAEGGARPGTAVKAAPSGDRAWSYTIPVMNRRCARRNCLSAVRTIPSDVTASR